MAPSPHGGCSARDWMPASPCSASAIIMSAAPARRRRCWRWQSCCANSARRRSCSAAAMAEGCAGPVRVDPARHAASDVGDEPLMLADALPVVVSRERVDGVALARSQGATVILMDDGFQNPAIAKDASLIVIDGARGLGNGQVFPAGPLRAPLRPQLARTDALIVVGDGDAAEAVAAEIAAQGKPVLSAHLKPDDGVRSRSFAASACWPLPASAIPAVLQHAARQRHRCCRRARLRRSSSVFARRDRKPDRGGQTRCADAGDDGKGSGAAARRVQVGRQASCRSR